MVKVLRAKLSMVKGSFTRIRNFALNLNDKALEECESRLEKLSEIWDNYRMLVDQMIEKICEDYAALEELGNDQADFEENYHKVTSLIRKHVATVKEKDNSLDQTYNLTAFLVPPLETAPPSKRQLLLISSYKDDDSSLKHSKDQINNLLQKKNVTTILFVPYAQYDHVKYNRIVRIAFSVWGYKVEGLHTKSDPIDVVKNAEAIFIGGGNSFVLLKTLYEKNLIDCIRERVHQDGIPYIGSSAGTDVATRSIHTTNDVPAVYPPTFDGLNLVPFNINPLYLDADPETEHEEETRDEMINNFIDYHELPVLALREGSSVFVDGNNAVLMGDRDAKLFKIDKKQDELPPQSDLSFLLKLG